MNGAQGEEEHVLLRLGALFAASGGDGRVRYSVMCSCTRSRGAGLLHFIQASGLEGHVLPSPPSTVLRAASKSKGTLSWRRTLHRLISCT
jgi:hypothetical protein